ncbi:MAG: nucleoside hydrolase [Sphingomonadales bacterium]|nr:nucleoside hydrolase [Sphingomonadales bacterium]
MPLSRRQFAGSLAAGALLAPIARAAPMIPQRASARVIIDNDFSGDPDGLVALVHQLLSPKTRTTLITTSALNARFVEPALAGHSAAIAADIARECLRRTVRGTPIPVAAGTEDFSLAPSPAARGIVAEAMRDDPLPLILTCGGPLTNVAAALRLQPAIAARMTVVWIGGGGYPDGGWEYNLATDETAARAVIEQSTVPIWQVPQPAYRQMQFSVAEMATEMRAISPLGRWLYDHFTHPPAFIDVGGAWPLGDSPLALLTAVSAESSRAVDRPARRILAEGRYGAEIPGRNVRVFEQLDARLAWADFLAKLRLRG